MAKQSSKAQPININQQPPLVQNDMTPDQAAAALALVTNISNGLLPKAPQTQENGSQGANDTQTQMDTMQQEHASNMADLEGRIMQDLDKKIQESNKQLETKIEKEISNLRDDIKSALDDESQE